MYTPVIKHLIAFTLLLNLLVGCSDEKLMVVESDFQKLTEFYGDGSEQQMGIFGGAGRKKVKPVAVENAEFEVKNGHLNIDFKPGGSFQFVPQAIGLPASWASMKQLQLVVETKGVAKVLVEIYGNRTRLIDTLDLRGVKLAKTIDVREVPLLGGIESKPLYVKFTALTPIHLTFSALSLVETDQQTALVDRWGQRDLAEYPTKISSLPELINTNEERRLLDSLPLHQELDVFGGFTDLEVPLDGTGFFHTQFAQGRWWLVTPDGNPFFSLGVNGVRIKSFRSTADVTRIEGREWMFEKVPPYQDCPECFLEDSTYFSFYCWNVKRKYEELAAWRRYTYERLETIGFNTIGNWSDTLFYQDAQMPYTYTLDTRKDERFIMENRLPDVFHPEWGVHLTQTFSEIDRFKNDPYLLGYFVDNEMGWRSIPRLDSTSYTFEALAGKTPEEQMGLYAEQYFSTIAAAIEQFDPNHLYLGCRFTRNFRLMQPVAEAAGQHIDVLSINVYSAYPIRKQMDKWYEAARKPILIGEHHIPPETGKQFLPHYPAFADSAQQAMTTNYVTTWATYPYSLGSHWYQFKDQEVAGRGDGGENQPIGIVTITDKLNPKMVRTYYSISTLIPQVLREQISIP